MSEGAIALAKILLLNDEYRTYFSTSGIISYCFRSIGQLFSWLINTVFDPASNFINEIYKYATGAGIAQNSGIVDSFSAFNFLVPFFVFLSILIYFLSKLFDEDNKVKSSQVIKRFIFASAIIVTGITFFNMINNLTYKTIKFIDIGSSSYQYGENVKNHTYDLVYLLNNVNTNGRISNSAINKKNNLPIEYCSNINATEVIDEPKDMITQGVRKNDVIEMLKYKPYVTNEGKIDFLELDDNFLFMDEHYYRYKIDWVSVIIAQLCSMIVIIFTCLGIIRRVFDATCSFAVLVPTAFADLTKGKLTKNLIEYIIKCYVTIVLTAFVYKIYSYLIISIPSSFNTFGQIVIIIALSFIAIDGPAFIERVMTGQDGGIGDGFKAASQLRNSALLASSAVSGIKNLVSSVGSNSNNTVGNQNIQNSNNSSMNKEMDKDNSKGNVDINSTDKNNSDNINGNKVNDSSQQSNGLNNDMNSDLSTNDSGFNDDMSNDLNQLQDIEDINSHMENSYGGNEGLNNMDDFNDGLNKNNINNNYSSNVNKNINHSSNISGNNINSGMDKDINKNRNK